MLVVSDHAHGTAIIGTYDDERPGTQLREKLGTYTASKFPNYGPPNADGYPERVDVSRRLAFVFSGYPDYCETGRPYMDGENRPAVVNPDDSKINIANEKYCVPGSARRAGNLPFTALSGVHAADEVVLTAMGPGAEMVRGRMENTKVFRVMVHGARARRARLGFQNKMAGTGPAILQRQGPLSAWRTGRSAGLSPCRTSCARPRASRG